MDSGFFGVSYPDKHLRSSFYLQ